MPPISVITDPADAPLTPLEGRTVGVLGYGNQGAAHARNLRDSGLRVVVANRVDSANGRRAADDGFTPESIDTVVAESDLVVVALPDEVHGAVHAERIAPALRPGATLGFLHGFSLRFGHVAPRDDVGVVMVAPKGPGATLRARFERGQGIPCLLAVHHDPPGANAEALALAWAAGIGSARAAIVRTTVGAEAESDLFGEQSVLCGGMTALMLAAFETMVDAGYPAELAYLECCQELKQVADLAYEGGLASMMERISNTAEFGAHYALARMVNEELRARFRELLDDVKSGAFAAAFERDYQMGFPWFEEQREALRRHAIEDAGRAVREWFPWLRDGGD